MDGTLLALTLLLSGGTANERHLEPLVGTWKVSISQETRDIAAKTGMALPSGKLKLRADRSFEYACELAGKTTTCVGSFEFAGEDVLLKPATPVEAWPIAGMLADVQGDAIQLDGFKFAKLAPIDMSGTWLLKTATSEDPSTKLIFTKKGTFEFQGQNAESKGKYLIDEDRVTLLWTEVDGAPVKEGSMRKVVSVDELGRLLKLDRFQYIKK